MPFNGFSGIASGYSYCNGQSFILISKIGFAAPIERHQTFNAVGDWSAAVGFPHDDDEKVPGSSSFRCLV